MAITAKWFSKRAALEGRPPAWSFQSTPDPILSTWTENVSTVASFSACSTGVTTVLHGLPSSRGVDDAAGAAVRSCVSTLQLLHHRFERLRRSCEIV
jgi:hypothetical protein